MASTILRALRKGPDDRTLTDEPKLERAAER